MGKVAVSFRILPEGVEVDRDAVQAKVREALGARVRKLEVRPVAFGLRAVEAIVVVDDASGEVEGVEAALNRIPGVGGVETTEVTLL
jgi:elongation factor 1-beta